MKGTGQMKKINTTPLALLFIIIAIVGNTVVAQAPNGNLCVITNSKGSPTELKLTELMAVMKGEKQRWNDGTKISIALMKTSTQVGEATSKKIYGMTGDELNKFWLALVFQGKAKAPMFFSSTIELETYVQITPGAIGIIEESGQVKLKPISVDGKKSF